MSPEFAALAETFNFSAIEDPSKGMYLLGGDPAFLAGVLVSMNRQNPGATRTPNGKAVYEGTARGKLPSLMGEQAHFVFEMFNSGYFDVGCNGQFIFNLNPKK